MSTHCQHEPNLVHTSTSSPQAGHRQFFLYFNQYGNYTTFHTIYVSSLWVQSTVNSNDREGHEGTLPSEMQKVNRTNACYWTVFLYGVVWRITWWIALLPSWYILLSFNKTIIIRYPKISLKLQLEHSINLCIGRRARGDHTVTLWNTTNWLQTWGNCDGAFPLTPPQACSVISGITSLNCSANEMAPLLLDFFLPKFQVVTNLAYGQDGNILMTKAKHLLTQ